MPTPDLPDAPSENNDLMVLLLRCGEGDQVAFAQLYDATSQRLYGIVRRTLRDPDLAAEVTQEVYVEIWRLAARYRPSEGSPLGWICAIGHRRAVDRVRAVQSQRRRDENWTQQNRVVAGAAEQSDPVAEDVVGRFDADQVHRGLGQLSPPQREVLVLAYFEGHTQSGIAELLGLPLGTVKTRIRDGLKRLRAVVEEGS